MAKSRLALPHFRHTNGENAKVAGANSSAVLQARMFAYNDAARYRLGVNYQQLPCNKPVSPVYSPYQRDGFMNTTTNYGGDPNYVRSALRPINFKGQVGANGVSNGGHEEWVGSVAGFTTEVTDDDFVQPRMFWEVLGRQEGQQEHWVYNVSQHLKGAIPEIREKAYGKRLTADFLLPSMFNLPELTRTLRNSYV